MFSLYALALIPLFLLIVLFTSALWAPPNEETTTDD